MGIEGKKEEMGRKKREAGRESYEILLDFLKTGK